MSTLFDAGFRRVLHAVLRQARALRGPGDAGERARLRRMGVGGSFAGHRAYTAGEDLRLLDWNAFARSRELHVKVLEEEHRRALTILLDGSLSMAAGSPPRFDHARRLAALIGVVALAQLDALVLWVGKQRSDFGGSQDFERLLTALDAARPDGSRSDEPVEQFVRGPARGRVVWLSDFADAAEFTRALRLLGPSRRRVLGLLPETSDDRSSSATGLIELDDVENGEAERLVVDDALRSAFAEELRLHARRVDAAFRAAGVALLRQRAHEANTAAQWTEGGWLEWLR
ncbi:MAG: DUF58 domain-containing protein [Planctomycetota bacterium]